MVHGYKGCGKTAIVGTENRSFDMEVILGVNGPQPQKIVRG